MVVGNPLTASMARLHRHFVSIQAMLDQFIPQLQVNVGWGLDPLTAGLVGPGCEITARNRGLPTFVAPLRDIRKGLVAWLGFHEKWVRGTSNNPVSGQFSFRSSALTIHVGTRNSRDKPQMFRAEWQGAAPNVESSRDARKGPAHPHWQVDALESFADYETEAQELLALLMEEGQGTLARDFSLEELLAEEHGEMMAVRKNLSRLHFASAAAWWRSPPDNGHAHAPASLAEVESWLHATLEYTVDELRRL